MSDIVDLFHTLDAPFINFSKNSEPITWQAKEILVHKLFDVKIPTTPGSTIKYSFSTEIGDIYLSAQFLMHGRPNEIIIEPIRVPSDKEEIAGTFRAVRDGTFVLIFDNNFSWFNPKLLSYKIALFQPAFALADANRCIQSRRILDVVTKDAKLAQVSLSQAIAKEQQLRKEVEGFEAHLEKLMQELQSKKNVLQFSNQEVSQMESRINYFQEKRIGLFIRSLEKKLLSKVLEFVGKEPSSYLVCKYWKALIDG